MPPRFYQMGEGGRKEMEAAWKVSPERNLAIQDLSIAEIKRRRY